MNLDTLLLSLGITVAAVGYGLRVRHWLSGGKAQPLLPLRARARVFFSRALLQRPLHAGGWRAPLMHGLIFWGCAGLAVSSLELLPNSLRFWPFDPPNVHRVALLAREAGTLALLAGCAMAIHRRYIKRWERLTLDLPGDRLVLGLLLAVPLSGVLTVGARLPQQPLEAEPVALLGHAASLLLASLRLEPSYAFLRTLHVALVAGLLAVLPFTRLRHVLVAPLAILIGPVHESGRTEESAGEPLPWALRLQLDACSGCGRCDKTCAPGAEGARLSPQRILMAQRRDECAPEIDAATLALCTLCGDCEAACPVGIAHLPRLRALQLQRASQRGPVPAGDRSLAVARGPESEHCRRG